MRPLGWFLSIYATLFVTDWLVYGDPLAAYPPPSKPSVIALASSVIPEPTVGLAPATLCAGVVLLKLQAIGPVR